MFQAVDAGADDGNRTHTTSLEGWSSTTKLHLQGKRIYYSRFAWGLSRAEVIKIKSKLKNHKPARCAGGEIRNYPPKKASQKRRKIYKKFIATTFQKTLDEF